MPPHRVRSFPSPSDPASRPPCSPRCPPPQDLVSPVVLGAEHLPPEGSVDWARPMLFVGNHGKVSAEAEQPRVSRATSTGADCSLH